MGLPIDCSSSSSSITHKESSRIIEREQRCVCGRVVRARVSLLLADFLSTIKQQTETDREATDCVSNARVRSFFIPPLFFFEALLLRLTSFSRFFLNSRTLVLVRCETWIWQFASDCYYKTRPTTPQRREKKEWSGVIKKQSFSLTISRTKQQEQQLRTDGVKINHD